MSRKERSTNSYTRVFGLVARSDKDGTLLLSQSRRPLADILEEMATGAADDRIHKKFRIREQEIKAARAYMTRFGPDPARPAQLPERGKAVLLDENIPYTLLPYVHRAFGPSSHVEAEGFSRQNLSIEAKAVHRKRLDKAISHFAAAAGFPAIVTCDTDFQALYKIPDHPVRAVAVFLIDNNVPGRSVQACLRANEGFIRRTIDMLNTGQAAPQLYPL